MKIFLEYEENTFSHLISLDKVIISFKEAVFSQIIDKSPSNKILHIKLINDNFWEFSKSGPKVAQHKQAHEALATDFG